PPLAGLETVFGAPRALLHLDLHPRNVLLSSRGAVVIDWANAANGPGQADVALMWIIGKTSRIEAPVLVRPALARSGTGSSKRSARRRPTPASLRCCRPWRRGGSGTRTSRRTSERPSTGSSRV